jgi:hypothetical protein
MDRSLSRVKRRDRYAHSKHPLPQIGQEITSNSHANSSGWARSVSDGWTFMIILLLNSLLAGKGFRSLLDFRSPFCFAG